MPIFAQWAGNCGNGRGNHSSCVRTCWKRPEGIGVESAYPVLTLLQSCCNSWALDEDKTLSDFAHVNVPCAGSLELSAGYYPEEHERFRMASGSSSVGSILW